MKAVYIKSAVAISAQDTFSDNRIPEELTPATDSVANALQPEYKDYISPASARRMAPAVKMGIAAASKALSLAGISNPDGIIAATGMGCLMDTEKFLNNILENKEEFITPTSFIQSTHNTVAGQIGIMLDCKAYNSTYVHGSLSFESALVDAQLQIEEGAAKNILVGAVDELGIEFHQHTSLRNSQRKSTTLPAGEGAAFFVISDDKEQAMAQLTALETLRNCGIDQLQTRLHTFLTQSKCKLADIDLLVLGGNGGKWDTYYDRLRAFFPNIRDINYKQLTGEHHSASAFACWLASILLSGKSRLNEWDNRITDNTKPRLILLYNQSEGMNHSFMLLKEC